MDLSICKCSPAALQLVNIGLFPCAPYAPLLAVDISLLQFTQALFVRLAPNTTSFCETLEYFLGCRGYKLTTRVSQVFGLRSILQLSEHCQESLRRRFGNALLWYSSLNNVLNRHIQGIFERARLRLLSDADGPSLSGPNGMYPPFCGRSLSEMWRLASGKCLTNASIRAGERLLMRPLPSLFWLRVSRVARWHVSQFTVSSLRS